MSELENTYFILSKTKQTSVCMLQEDNCGYSDDLNLMFSTVQFQKSFYNKSERKTSKIFNNQDYLTNVDETTYGNNITMDITSIFFSYINVSKNIYI